MVVGGKVAVYDGAGVRGERAGCGRGGGGAARDSGRRVSKAQRTSWILGKI